MTEGDTTRLVAWSIEMRKVHERLHGALTVTREALDGSVLVGHGARDLLLFCRGFCAALTTHHRGEDRTLFPAIAAAHPELRDTLSRLAQDHSMIAHLLEGLEEAVERAAEPAGLERHLAGISAIMESHFRYEERQLLGVLETLELDDDARTVFGEL